MSGGTSGFRHHIHTLWGNVSVHWPRRLLHVPSMTSHERDESNSYGGILEPKYNILTYTWGRWQVSEGSSLDVCGTSWRIPAVDPTHFTVTDLEKVLQVISESVEFVWIDVACIDQENNAVKMEEVGRQVGIFQQAHRVYAWLNRLPPESLQEYVNVFLKDCVDIAYIYEPGEEDFLSAINRMQYAFTELLKDPWFTSLWTLQESVLRRDAVLLNRSVETVKLAWTENTPALLGSIASAGMNIHEWMEREWESDLGRAMDRDPILKQAVRDLLDVIERSGLYFLWSANPNIQYGCTRFRQTKFPEDRIYGIMQIYGLKIGQAARPEKVFTLSELEDEFAAVMNSTSPVLGQAFVHLEEAAPGQSWRIQRSIWVPTLLRGLSNTSHVATITVRAGGIATFSGGTCTMPQLLKSWNFAEAFDKPPDPMAVRAVTQCMFLDASGRVILSPNLHSSSVVWKGDPSVFRGTAIGLSKLPHQVFGRTLCEHFSADNLRVLRLGREEELDFVNEVKSPEWEPSVPLLEFALLLLRLKKGGDGKEVWRRIGLCCWNMDGWGKQVWQPEWVHLEGEFG